jgi:transcriptional regulator with XRE-family HTH domain
MCGMPISLQELGDQIQAAREERHVSQSELAKVIVPPTNRSAIAHLEQGRRLGDVTVLQRICEHLGIPARYWRPFLNEEYRVRVQFEEAVSELVGRIITLRFQDEHAIGVAQRAIASLFADPLTDRQSWDSLNSLLVYYDLRPMTEEFFSRYFSEDATKSPASLAKAVRKFQAEAIRLFSTFGEAYDRLNEPGRLVKHLEPLKHRTLDHYRNRRPWDVIETISQERLPDLGYISAARARQESGERTMVSEFLKALADKVDTEKGNAVTTYSEKRRRKMSSLLRKFNSQLQHDLMSPLFSPDADAIRREAAALAPKDKADLDRIEKTQSQAQRNLARYLSADYLDVYVATSMRTDADFISVSAFTDSLFKHDELRALKLRFFDPTQSWIEDRVAKGLVEALMLRRSALTIYMAQKGDTFGKDSEASVALGQGKPVVVYVPKLSWPDGGVDSEELTAKSRSELEAIVSAEGDADDKEPDPTVDEQALVARILTLRLHRLDLQSIAALVRLHWADFDLYGEDNRIQQEPERAKYRAWLDDVRQGKVDLAETPSIRHHLERILVAVATRFEQRAKLFREQHPLALQVIVSTGVLNGMLVARSADLCARLVASLLRNDQELELVDDDHNYRLVDRLTGSVIRVISRHSLIVNAFTAFYSNEPRQSRGV